MTFDEMEARGHLGGAEWHAKGDDLGPGYRREAYTLTHHDLLRLAAGDLLELDAWREAGVFLRVDPANAGGVVIAQAAPSPSQPALEVHCNGAMSPAISITGKDPASPLLRLRAAPSQVAPLVTVEGATGFVVGGIDSAGKPFGSLETLKVEVELIPVPPLATFYAPELPLVGSGFGGDAPAKIADDKWVSELKKAVATATDDYQGHVLGQPYNPQGGKSDA